MWEPEAYRGIKRSLSLDLMTHRNYFPIYIPHIHFVLFNQCLLLNFPIKTLGISAILMLAIRSGLIISVYSDHFKLCLNYGNAASETLSSARK